MHTASRKTAVALESPPTVQAVPNPFRDVTTIHFPNPNQKPYYLQLYNGHGQLLRQISGRSNQVLIDRTGLPKGIYFYRIQFTNSLLGTGKLIVLD